jgi:hypothetical protein
MPSLAHRSAPPATPSPERLARVGLTLFARLADEWSLSSAEQLALLGLTSRETLRRWMQDRERALGRDTLERLSHLVAIYDALGTLFAHSDETRRSWVRRPNTAPLFGGRPALALMTATMSGLSDTRRYLDGMRDGAFG